ncbi:EamA family transporter [Marinomonas mediterranea]|uniref:DMT family transporter n=1 Tax=Marinomonas mediterranea TaxID=119864 RepID=UPI00234988B4|nr:DMT family transporter [Marinomonas mediterranea]WCN15070.1 EamA family transporter [Marinomonas mediterranea]
MPNLNRDTNTAILMMCTGVACLSINDAFAKVLMEHYSAIQILFVRTVLAFPFALFLAFYTGGASALRSHKPAVHVVRSLLWIAATIMFFTSVKYLDLATATALIFVAPLFIAIISSVFLKEPVSRAKWLAILAGFVGMLIIVRPGLIAFNAVTALPIATAVVYALLMLGARQIDPRESVWTQVLYLTGISGILSGLLVPFVWTAIRVEDLWLFAAITLFGITGMALMTQAFRLGSAVVIAPLDYTGLLWATLLGWLFWAEMPDTTTLVGAIVIVASGTYIIKHAKNTA